MAEEYVIQKTPEQIEDAIDQLNKRIAEGWTDGTRDGVPVSSDSPYFENNARWWALKAGASETVAVDAKDAAEDAKADALEAKEDAETAEAAAQAAAAVAQSLLNGQMLTYDEDRNIQLIESHFIRDGHFVLRYVEVNS